MKIDYKKYSNMIPAYDGCIDPQLIDDLTIALTSELLKNDLEGTIKELLVDGNYEYDVIECNVIPDRITGEISYEKCSEMYTYGDDSIEYEVVSMYELSDISTVLLMQALVNKLASEDGFANVIKEARCRPYIIMKSIVKALSTLVFLDGTSPEFFIDVSAEYTAQLARAVWG